MMSKVQWSGSSVRGDFPLLARTMRTGKPLIYLDSAATAQKPVHVLDAERNFYEQHNAAAHRGSHQLAEEATEVYEASREKIAQFIGASPRGLVFTKSATESLNLIAYAILNASVLALRDVPQDPRFVISEGDNIVVTELEHHANLVPWQELCLKTGAELRWVPVKQDGTLEASALGSLVDSRTKVVSCAHVSNALGHVLPIELFAEAARSVGALFVLDSCQAVPHMTVNVADTGADFIAFSAHKMLGPTGLGLLWGRPDLLDVMPVVSTGGSMISNVTMVESTYQPAPLRFEPGVPSMAQAVGTAAAVEYLRRLGMDAVERHVRDLAKLTAQGLADIPKVRVLISPDGAPVSAVSFVLDGIHPHDVGQVLDDDGIAVRVGHHCAWPLMRALGVSATVRASFSVYNDDSDVAALIASVRRAGEFFA